MQRINSNALGDRRDTSSTSLSCGRRYRPEDNPFSTLVVDVTHRCNMACHNCYIPNRYIPDMDADWLYDILARLPRRTKVRLMGAEATLRDDLMHMIRTVRALGHHPSVLTNGLKLARPDYVAGLKSAGLRVVYLSMNGGTHDAYYQAIDGQSCAAKKMRALENLCSRNMYVSIGMIVVRDVNDQHIGDFFRFLSARRQIRELHLRGVGRFGTYLDTEPYTVNELLDLFRDQTGIGAEPMDMNDERHVELSAGSMRIQFTPWPELNSGTRGRLTPEGFIEPAFEHILANENGY